MWCSLVVSIQYRDVATTRGASEMLNFFVVGFRSQCICGGSSSAKPLSGQFAKVMCFVGSPCYVAREPIPSALSNALQFIYVRFCEGQGSCVSVFKLVLIDITGR